jgi:imidazolonepropionase
MVILDAPSYTHLVYRPGVPLIAATLVGGVPTTADVR